MDSPALIRGPWPFAIAGLVLLVSMFSSAVGRAAESKAFGGVGLQVVPTATGELAVLAVVENSPAQKAGLKPGDLIIAVDGYPMRGSDFREVVQEYLWGPVGSVSVLTFLRPGEAGVRRLEVERIPLQGVRPSDVPGVRMLEPGEEVSPGTPN